MNDDVFDINILDSRSKNCIADKLVDEKKSKLDKLRIDLFNGIYENVLNCVKNNNKYLHKSYCVYSLPQSFKGVVLHKELKRAFMKALITKLHRENFFINLVNKETIFISW
jgi:hypothetical protein